MSAEESEEVRKRKMVKIEVGKANEKLKYKNSPLLRVYTGLNNPRKPGIPPPIYPSHSCCFTLFLKHGGKFVKRPVVMYYGGKVVAFDYFSRVELTIERLNRLCFQEKVVGTLRFFGLKGDDFKPLVTDADLQEWLKIFPHTHEVEICVEVLREETVQQQSEVFQGKDNEVNQDSVQEKRKDDEVQEHSVQQKETLNEAESVQQQETHNEAQETKNEAQETVVKNILVEAPVVEIPVVEETVVDDIIFRASKRIPIRGRGKGRGKGSASMSGDVVVKAKKKKTVVKGRGRGKSKSGVEGTGSNLHTSQPIRSGLLDEDDTEFEALLSQANNSGMIPGPTPWDQLKMNSAIPDEQVLSGRTSVGGSRAMFSTMSRGSSKNKMFLAGSSSRS